MPNVIVLGAQWGDEGKGKVVDFLAADADFVVRYQGGANAGHTVVAGGKKFVLHLVPSGILSANCVSVIGNGCVVDPVTLLEELETLRGQGIEVSPQRLKIAANAHVVTPFHKATDRIEGGAIGTTGRGIGPCYVDKVRRCGLTMGALVSGQGRLTLENQSIWHHHQTNLNQRPTPPDYPSAAVAIDELERAAEQLWPFVADTLPMLADAVATNARILFEGAQGTLLDVDHGTYPFVTSSNTTIGGAYTGSGVYFDAHSRIAVMKAYTTRVGNGPFATELHDTTGESLRQRGHEFGATTGRPRRCGWLDMPALTRAFAVNGFNGIALMKLDVLRGIDPIRVAVGYSSTGAPVWEEFEGFDTDISGVTSLGDLPEPCRKYVEFLSRQLGVPIRLLSTGPERESTFVQEMPW